MVEFLFSNVERFYQRNTKEASFRGTIPGTDLLSRDLAVQVPLAWMGLTAVFGMGTGVAPSREAPGILPPKLFFNSPIGKSSGNCWIQRCD
jgi:hypothetical protein